MTAFYIFTPIAALLTVWFLGAGNTDNDVLGKLIASVLVLGIYFLFLFALGWRKENLRKKKIRSAVLSPANTKRVVVLPDNPE